MSAKKQSRREARAEAFQFLYGLCFTPIDSLDGLRAAFNASPHALSPDAQLDEVPDNWAHGFVWEMVQGVWSCLPELDAQIEQQLENWRVERLGRVELTILRLALYELLHDVDTPSQVVVNEALELGKRFGDTKSRTFINGILDAAIQQIAARATQ